MGSTPLCLSQFLVGFILYLMSASDAVDAYTAAKLLARVFGSCQNMHLSRLRLLRSLLPVPELKTFQRIVRNSK